jgi:TatD DNase family protein
VSAVLNIATKAGEWDAIAATAERFPDVWATVGVHPHDADAHADVTATRCSTRARHARIVGIGETGLDYH